MQEAYSDELYGLMVPLAEERLLLPRVTIAEVITWQQPEKVDNVPPWYLGVIQWNGRPIPIISFEAMCGQAFPPPGGRTRIAVVVAIGAQLTSGYFGIVTQGFPQLVRANADVVKPELNHSFSDRSPIICRVRMLNESPLIPDLPRMEEMISEESRRLKAQDQEVSRRDAEIAEQEGRLVRKRVFFFSRRTLRLCVRYSGS